MSTALNPGSIFDNRYVIIEALGAGGMGIVYKCKQVGLERIVALKILNSSLLVSTESEARFQREAKILSLLNQKNIASFYQYGVADGHPYIAMEFVGGQSLRSVLNQVLSSGLPWKRAIAIASQIAEALAYAHGQGVVHRDLKPDNIIVSGETENPNVVLIDFGLSSVTDPQNEELQKLTKTGDLIGSINYLSPELCKGLKPDSRADIYSLGVIIYEMITGHPPFEADSPVGVVYKHSNESPSAFASKIQNTPAQVEAVVFRCLAKDPGKRYQTASTLLEDLQHLLKGEFNEIDSSAVNAVSGSRKNPITIAFLVVGIIALAAIAATVINWKQRSTSSEVPAPTAASSTAGHTPEAKIRGYFNLVTSPDKPEEQRAAIADLESLRPRLKGKRVHLFVADYAKGRMLYILGDYPQAEEAFLQALKVCKEKDGTMVVNAIHAYLQLAKVYAGMSEPQKAIDTLMKARRIWDAMALTENYPAFPLAPFRNVPKDDPVFYIPYMLAENYGKLGRFDEANKRCAEASFYAQKIKNTAAVIRSKLVSADLLALQGQPEKGRKQVDAIKITRTGDESDYELNRKQEACMLLGQWYLAHNERKKAKYWFQETFRVCGPVPDDSELGILAKQGLALVDSAGQSPEIKLKNSLDFVFESTKEQKLAAIKTIDAVRPMLESKRPELFVADFMRGYYSALVGQHDQALSAYKRSLLSCKEKDGRLSINAARVYMQMAKSYLATSKVDDAKQALFVAYDILAKSEKDDNYPALNIHAMYKLPKDNLDFTIPYLLADVYAKEQDFENAYQWCARARAYSVHVGYLVYILRCDVQKADLLVQQGKLAEAMKLVDSITIPENDVSEDRNHEIAMRRSACLILARWYASHKQYAKSRFWYERQLTIFPFSKPSETELTDTRKGIQSLDKIAAVKKLRREKRIKASKAKEPQ